MKLWYRCLLTLPKESVLMLKCKSIWQPNDLFSLEQIAGKLYWMGIITGLNYCTCFSRRLLEEITSWGLFQPKLSCSLMILLKFHLQLSNLGCTLCLAYSFSLQFTHIFKMWTEWQKRAYTKWKLPGKKSVFCTGMQCSTRVLRMRPC